ncbi:hypothetical protein ASG89_18050 [Paenibacillus sp. Soil766]|uniref:galactose-binding domain-containing protein n=1 Tax=Paenibacillus sp. Soil766 TaxID=1736404 RepID=UPI00070C3A02|nr:discoidin domain-containing protein [Paenibacillus sp. Soil766]KRF06764.1 hypothetical protein ASG89_18050 [Paenibacillus sp. Soil766]
MISKSKLLKFCSLFLIANIFLSVLSLPAKAADTSTSGSSTQTNNSSAIFEQPVINDTVSAAGFVHPSIGFSSDSLRLMQQKIAIGEEPWVSAFESFRNSPSGSLDYDIRNKSKLDPSKPAYTKVDNDAKAKEAKVDAAAAIADAVIWTATGDIRYRAKAMEIIRLWSRIDPTNPVGFTDSHISIGDAMSDMVRAAELLRYTECVGEWGWTDQDTSNFTNNFLMAFYDGSFYHSNGRWMNQHGIVTLAYMMAAIFSDNMPWYQEAVEWATVNKTATYKGQSGDIFHQIRYVTQNERTGTPVAPHVQLVEMFRDMGHASGNLGALSKIAYLTELQGTKVNPDPVSATFGELTSASNGVGLFEFLDDRLLTGANLFSKYNLGYEIPYTPVNISNAIIGDPAPTGNYADTITDNGRGLGAASELIYGYYTHLNSARLNPSDERIKYLSQSVDRLGGLATFPSYVLLQGTEDLSTGKIVGPPKPLSQPTYAELKLAYSRMQAYDFLGRSATTSTNTFQDQDGLRSVLYDVRYANQFTWYDLDIKENSFDNITIRAASNSSVGTKVDVILLDNVAGIDRSNVTLDNLSQGEVLATLQVPNTAWWTNYATVSGKLSRPITGKHLLAFKYYGSDNWLSYQIAFDWFALSNSYAGVENNVSNAVLSGPATLVSDGVQLENGGSISFSKMDFDSGINSAEFNAKTTDSNGKLLVYSDGVLVTTYNLTNTSGSMIKFISEIITADIAKITGIHDISIRYEGSSPIVLKTFRNIERNRLLGSSTTTSNALQIEDQAVSISGSFESGVDGSIKYVKATNGSIFYLSQAVLQADRTKDNIVSFTVKSNGEANLNLQRDRTTVPFATIRIPDTKGQWIKVSTNISSKYVNPDDYPTNLKSVFISMSSAIPNTELLLDKLELDPVQVPPTIKLLTAKGDEIQSIMTYEHGSNFDLQVAIQDPDSVNVMVSADQKDFMENNLMGKGGGTLTIKPAALAQGEYSFHIYAQDDTGNYVDKEVKLIIYSQQENHAPVGLTVNVTGATSTDLQWSPVKGASYYAIYRMDMSIGSYVKVADSNATTYSDTSMSPNTTYKYKVTAGGVFGETTSSDAVTVTTLSKIVITPSMVKASTLTWPTTGTPESNGWLAFDGNTTTATDTTTNPSWIVIDLGAGNEQVVGAMRFYPRSSNISRINAAVIQGSNDGTTFVDLYTINNITAAKWYFAPISNSASYRYIRFYTPKGNANVAELEFFKKLKPAAPDGIQAVAGNAQVQLNWQGVTNAVYYTVNRSLSFDGSFSAVQTNIEGTSFTDTNLTNTETYYYVVTASNTQGESISSAKVDATPYVAATSLSVTGAGGSTAISTVGGTLQLNAFILPSGTTYPTVSWAVYDVGGVAATDKATIQLNGLLTALKNGVVKVTATVQDGSGTQGSAFIVINGQSPVTSSTVSAVITAPSSVVGTEAFHSSIGFSNVSNAVYGVDLKITYNSDALQFESAQSLKSGFTLVSANNDIPGKIRILAVSTSAAGAISVNSDIIQLNWIAKQVPSTTAAPINLTQVLLSDGSGALMTAEASSQQLAVIFVNRVALASAIQNANNEYIHAVEGNQIGQYQTGAMLTLNSAIQAANSVNSNSLASQLEVDAAANSLNLALNEFHSKLITIGMLGDFNSNGKVDIGDLALMALQYGITSISQTWNDVKKFDVDGDNIIDIADLVFVAKLIQ